MKKLLILLMAFLFAFGFVFSEVKTVNVSFLGKDNGESKKTIETDVSSNLGFEVGDTLNYKISLLFDDEKNKNFDAKWRIRGVKILKFLPWKKIDNNKYETTISLKINGLSNFEEIYFYLEKVGEKKVRKHILSMKKVGDRFKELKQTRGSSVIGWK